MKWFPKKNESLQFSHEFPLDWVDDYICKIRPYIHVRKQDNLLIKIPNEAFKLNDTAINILTELLRGRKICEIWQRYGTTKEIQRDLYYFFIALKQAMQGCLNEYHPPKGVHIQPFQLGFNTLPVLSEVALTYRCNLRCRFCYAHCVQTMPNPKREMSTEEVQTVLSRIRKEADVPSVSFTGGEPLLRQDLAILIQFARKDLNMHVNLITNGTLIDQKCAENLRSAGLNSAQVSLEAPEPDLHDALTGILGSFEQTIAGIGYLKNAGIRVHTNTTLNSKNISVAHLIPNFVASLGLQRFSMNVMIPSGPDTSTIRELSIRYKDLPQYILRIKQAAHEAGVEFLWYSPTPICIFNPVVYHLGNKGCAACDGLLSVSPSGDVLPCSAWHESMGNLLHTPFETIWHARRTQQIRAKAEAPNSCHNCSDFALCQGACPLYWRWFGYNELSKLPKEICYVTSRS